MKFKLIKQQDEKDCGVACISMILNYYKTEVPTDVLRTFSGTDNEGTSVYGLKKCIEKFNFDCQAIRTNSIVWDEKELVLPLIAHVLINNEYFHYVVVYKVQGDILYIADPDKGMVKKTVEEFGEQWTGALLLMAPNKKYRPSVEKVNGISTYLPILLNEKGLIFNIVIASFFITLFGLFSSYYFQGIIDYFIPNNIVSTFNIISLGLIFIYVFQVILEYVRGYLLTILGQRMSISIMLSYFKHVLNLPLSFFSTRKSGEIISRFLDANKIIDALASATLSIFLDVGIVITIGITLFIQNKGLFFIALGSIPFYGVAILSFVKIFDQLNEDEMSAGATVNASIIESLKGIETIKAYNGEQKVYDKVDQQFTKWMKTSFKFTNLDNLQQSFKHLIQLISTILVLWLGSYYVMNGSITLGQLITFNSLLLFFTEPLQSIINLQTKMQAAQVANRRINDIFAIKTEKQENSNNKNIDSSIFKSGITIKNVSFSYGLKEPVLKNISTVINAGEKVAIVGVSGSGKSTLAKLMVNFYAPMDGELLYKKINVLDIDHEILRNHVTYVPQESFFFHGTILENLLFSSNKEVTFERIVEVCEDVQILDFVNQQELRFDMIVEEGATNLSGGQKQRLAIARALLKDADILILDEATSSLDPISEYNVLRNLMKLSNKTILFIAHHLSIAKASDKLLVLDQGELVEQGEHAELLEKNGMYRKLWEIDN